MPLTLIFVACLAIDGDTLRCGPERIRLTGIDTPERYEPGYQEAKDVLQFLIEGKPVTCIVQGRDRYGRMLGDCSAGGRPLSAYLLDTGLAKPYKRWRQRS